VTRRTTRVAVTIQGLDQVTRRTRLSPATGWIFCVTVILVTFQYP